MADHGNPEKCSFADGFAAAVMGLQAHSASRTTDFCLVRRAILPRLAPHMGQLELIERRVARLARCPRQSHAWDTQQGRLAHRCKALCYAHHMDNRLERKTHVKDPLSRERHCAQRQQPDREDHKDPGSGKERRLHLGWEGQQIDDGCRMGTARPGGGPLGFRLRLEKAKYSRLMRLTFPQGCSLLIARVCRVGSCSPPSDNRIPKFPGLFSARDMLDDYRSGLQPLCHSGFPFPFQRRSVALNLCRARKA